MVGTDGPAEVAYGWVSREAATLLLPASGEWCEMVTVAPAFVPASIVRVTGLGPRYTPVGGALRASAETVDHLFADDPAGRQAAAMRLVPDDSTSERAVTQFGEAERLLWRAAMTWTGPDQQETGRAVAVADTSAGLHVIEPDGDGAVLRPTTPSDVWRLLLLLVPTDHDLLQ
ncbi:MAG: hypothetical protein ACRDYU_04590 [Actinomycetes bacterium]